MAKTIPQSVKRTQALSSEQNADFAFLASFGAFVALMRVKKGWSQIQFAQLIGSTQPSVSCIENGMTSTSLTDFIIIADQVGVSPQKAFLLVRDATFLVKATTVRLLATEHSTITPMTIAALAYAHMTDVLANEQL